MWFLQKVEYNSANDKMESIFMFAFAFVVSFLKADCQVEFELTPENIEVTGSIGENVTLQWNIIKENDTDMLLVANLFLIGGSSLRTLYTLDPGTQKPLLVFADKIYGNRITADISNDKTYLLTLRELKYSDASSFELTVLITRGDIASTVKRAIIQLIVEVDSQVNFELTPEKRVVRGTVGEQVTLQWNIIKQNDADQLVAANLILIRGATDGQTLCTLDPSTQKPLLAYPKKGIFGNRIAADIKHGRTYILILQKLNDSDANLFELGIVIARGNVSSIVKKATIRLIVAGGKVAPQESKTNPWVIFGGVIGGIIFLIVAIVFFLWIRKKMHRDALVEKPHPAYEATGEQPRDNDTYLAISQNESRGVGSSQINMDLEPEERSTSEHTNRPPRTDTSQKEEEERNTGYYNDAHIFSG